MDIRLFNCGDSAFADVRKIRCAVFVAEQGVPGELEFDSYDEAPETVYCLVSEKQPCATARLIRTPNGYKVGRVATLPEMRQRGCGAAAVRALCERAFALGAEAVTLEAQLHAVGFYESLGFEIVSDEIIYDAGIAHRLMRKYHD